MPDTFLVTGGSGKTGRAVASRLAAMGHHVRTASRHAPAVPPAEGTEHVVFDWTDERTHGGALAGVGAIYLLPPVLVADPVPLMAPFIERALEGGAHRMVLLSASVIPEGGPGVGTVHRLLRERVPEWAVLQPSWFMNNFLEDHYMAEDAAAGFVMTATGDARIGFIDVEDIADVAAHALTDEPAHNAAHVLTGPEALSYADVAAVLTEVTGRPVEHRDATPAEVRARMIRSGVPEQFADILVMLEDVIRGGAEDRVTDAVQRITGRTPRSFQAFAERHAAILRGARRSPEFSAPAG
jgi:uncharacterized protein YbjT (DUF2867 family)